MIEYALTKADHNFNG